MPPETDDLFEQLLADCQEEYSKAQSDWVPDPPGDYLCIYRGLRTGSFPNPDDPTKKVYWFRPNFELQDPKAPQFDGMTFGWLMTTRFPTGMRAVRRFLEELTGMPTDILAESLKAEKDQVGIVCSVRIKANLKRPEYPICYLQEVVSRDKVAVEA
jgi:hypothetical protein